MSGQNTAIQYSFAGGELDIPLRSRIDWERRSGGAEIIKNGFVLPGGGAMKRGGFRYIDDCMHDDKPITLVEFEFAINQIYMLVFGENIMWVYWDFGRVLGTNNRPYQISTPYTAEQATRFRYAQDKDTLYFAHIDVAPHRLVRHGHSDWRWVKMFSDTKRVQSPVGLAFYSETSNGHNKAEYAVTSYRVVNGATQESIGYQRLAAEAPTIDPIKKTPKSTIQSCIDWVNAHKEKYGHLSGFPVIPDKMDLSSVLEDGQAPRWFHVNDKIDTLFRLRYRKIQGGFRNVFQTPNGNERMRWIFYEEDFSVVVEYVYMNSKGTVYEEFEGLVAGPYNTIILKEKAYGFINSGMAVDGVTKDQIYSNIQAFITKVNNANTVRVTNRIKWSKVSNAQGYFVYRRSLDSNNPNFYRVATVQTTNFEDNIEEILPQQYTPVKGENTFENSNDYPAGVLLFQQRLLYYQTKSKPSTIFGSTVGNFYDFVVNPSDDASGFEFPLASTTLNSVQDLVALRRLIGLTSGSEFINDIAGAISQRNIAMVQQSSSGASFIKAVIVDNIIIRVPRDQQSIESLEYSLQAESFVPQELTEFARHLLAGRRLIDLEYQRRPKNIIWALLDNGQLISCTFIPSQKLLAWTRHETDGEIQSIGTLNNNDGHDGLWAVVRRRTATGGYKQRLEYLEDALGYSEEENASARGFYVDSGLTMDSETPVTAVGNLSHLEGMDVAIMADGDVLEPQKVTNGRITLERAARLVHVGLPYEFFLRTLDLELPTRATIRDGSRQPWDAWVELYMSRELEYRVNGGKWNRVKVQDRSALGASPTAISGQRQLTFRAGGSREARFEFRSRNPVPCCVLGLTTEMQIGKASAY